MTFWRCPSVLLWLEMNPFVLDRKEKYPLYVKGFRRNLYFQERIMRKQHLCEAIESRHGPT